MGHAALPNPPTVDPRLLRSAQFWCSASSLDATLPGTLVCVANKGLNETVSPLDATLTKNRGGGPGPQNVNSLFAQELLGMNSFVFKLFRTLLHSPNTQPFCFQTIPNSFAKNTRGGGGPSVPSSLLPCPATNLTKFTHSRVGRSLRTRPVPILSGRSRLGRGGLDVSSNASLRLSTADCQPPLRSSTGHGPRVTSLATLFHPWHANASANTFSPISTGARRSRAPFAFRRIPWRHSLATIEVSEPRSRRTINIAGSKLAQDTVR